MFGLWRCLYFINIRSACSCARSDNDLDHGVGGGERHLRDKYGHVKALVFGHFGEFNDGLLKLADDISKSVAKQHHRMLGFKSENAGRSRAKAGVMRRLSMVALRSTARHVLRGLAIVGPPCIHEHNARETARRAHHDAFGSLAMIVVPRGAAPPRAGARAPAGPAACGDA